MQSLTSLCSVCFLGLALAACSDGGGSRRDRLGMVTEPGDDIGNEGSENEGSEVVEPGPRDPAVTLRMMAEPMERQIGVALATNRLSDGRYAAAAREFNSVTHENEMKWDAIEPQPGFFNFTNADTTIAFAEQNGMSVRGHTLVWHSQLAGWVSQLTTRDEVLAAMERHITTIVSRYRGRVFAWDVVNEAMTDGGGMPPRLRGSDPSDAGDPNNQNGNAGLDSIFRRLIGEDYIDRAFIIANAADPDALLFYNDFNAEGSGAKSDAVYNMVAGMVERGIPIHGVGLQMHVGLNEGNRSAAAIAANMQRIADLGLDIHITELDVSLCGMGTIEERRVAQRQRLAGITQVCIDQPRCTALTLWGVADPDSWRDNDCRGGGRSEPLLFDANYERKEAYYGVFDTLVAAAAQ